MSGRKNNIKQFQSVVAGAMSGNITSAVTDIQFLDDIGLQLNYSGSPTGTFSVQVSADHSEDFNGNVLVAGQWIPLTLSYWNGTSSITATSIPTSVGSPIYLDLALLSAPYIRVVYTAGSGSGTLNVFLTAKQV